MCSLGREWERGRQSLDSHSNGKGFADVHKAHTTGQRNKLEPWHGDTPAWQCRSVINSRHLQRRSREKRKD